MVTAKRHRFIQIIGGFVLLYFLGVYSFFRSSTLLAVMHYAVLLLILSFYILVSPKKTNFLIGPFLFCFIYPIIAAWQSSVIFGQSIFLGIASLRANFYFFFSFLLIAAAQDYKELIYFLNKFNICIAIISIILLYALGIDHIGINQYMANTNIIEVELTEDLIRGKKLTFCSNLMMSSYIYYMISLLKYPKIRKNWLLFLILMFYLFFVNKSRQNQLIIVVIYAYYVLHMGRITKKKICAVIIPIFSLIVISLWDPDFLGKFTAILGGENSEDSSTLARIASINAMIPYIHENYLLGVGNLSSHFMEYGFQYYFGSTFYVSDLGIAGAFLKGGIMLMVIYFLIFLNLFIATKRILNAEVKEFMRYLLVIMCLFLFTGYDVFCDSGSFIMATLFYPLFCNKPNSLINPNGSFYHNS